MLLLRVVGPEIDFGTRLLGQVLRERDVCQHQFFCRHGMCLARSFHWMWPATTKHVICAIQQRKPSGKQ